MKDWNAKKCNANFHLGVSDAAIRYYIFNVLKKWLNFVSNLYLI